MSGRLPDFLIVGAMKCGTTSLSRHLGSHPQVFMAPSKELYFFERDSVWSRGVDWYREQFAAAGDARAVGEATPNYMFFPRSVERIADTLPGVRAIACLRDPVDRAYSHYLHWREDMVRERRTFAQAVEDELAEGAKREVDDVQERTSPYFGYLARGNYVVQLERLAGAIGRGNVHVVLLDDLQAEPGATFREVCRFLGVDESFVPENLGAKENAYHQYRPAWLWKLMIRHRVFDQMPQRVARYLALEVMAPRTKPVPEMDAAVRARLVENFTPANRALAEWLERDLSSWS